MPTYTLENTKTGEVTTEIMSWSALQNYLSENPHLKQIVGAPPTVSGVASGTNKPDAGFRDILKTIKKRHPGSTVNTF